MERNFNVDRRFQIFCDKLTSNNVSKDLIIESSYNTIELSSNTIIFDGHVDLSMVTCNNINISNISEIVTKFLRVKTISLPSNVRISYNSVNDGYITNTRVGYNSEGIGRSDAYFTYINVSGGDSSFNNSLYINKNLVVDGTLTISNNLLINGANFASIETSFNNYKAALEQYFYSTKITTKDVSALNISISNELVVNKTAYINDLTISGQLLNSVLKVPNIFTIDPSGYDNHSGVLIINGDLTVRGAETTLSSSYVDICDVAIKLASNLENRLDLSNSNAGLDISNIASLKYNGSVWNFSGGQLTVDNKKVLFTDDISLAKRNIDLSINAYKTDFSSSFFTLKRNIDNSYNATYTRNQIDNSFILRANVDLSLTYLQSYANSSYISKNQLTISFDTIRTLMDVSYVSINSYQNTVYQNTVYQNTVYQYTYERLGEIITNLSGGTNDSWGSGVAINEEGNIFASTSSRFLRIYKYNDFSWVQISPDIYIASAVSLNSAGNIVAISDRSLSPYAGQVSVYRYVIDNSWVKISQFMTVVFADDAISLNSSGNILAIGSPFENSTGSYSGNTRVYKYITDGSWVPLGQTIPGETEYSYGGYSVSLNSSGSILAIGASYNNNAGGMLSGQVRIYRFTNDTSWVLISQDIDGTAQYDYFGYSVSLNGDGTLVACGAIAETRRGYAKVYKHISDGSWIPQGQIISGEATDDQFGFAVSLNKQGNILGIGAPYNDGTGTTNAVGHVRIYKYNDVSWIQIDRDIDGDTANDKLGFSLALNGLGNRFVVGAPYGSSGRGYVKVYNYQSSIVNTNPIIIPTSFNSFTEKLDISYLLNSVFEASHNNIKTRFDISFATINLTNLEASSIIIETINTKHETQRFDNSLWNQIGLDISNGPPLINNNKKIAVSNDGKVVALSSSSHSDISKGRIYVYELNYNQPSYNWRQLGLSSEIIIGVSNEDQFGWDLALSSDGRVVAGSSINSDASGINSGQVRIFELSNNTIWRQKGSVINGPLANSESGYSISLAGNGNSIAIGAWKDNSNGTNAGAVRVYDFSASVNDWRQQGQTIAGISGSFEGYATALSLDGQTLASASTIPFSISNGYVIHSFKNVGTSTFRPLFSGSVEVLIVGGGGAGGTGVGGGGGAGGVIYMPAVNVSSGVSYEIVVGMGGVPAAFGTSSTGGSNGQNSTAFNAIAAGGGTGGYGYGPYYPLTGGSGGGGGNSDTQQPGAESSGNSLGGNNGFIYGNRGGNRTSGSPRGGGGGGAGGSGIDNITSGAGGIGLQNSILGPNYYWGGGGGGGANSIPGAGGLGGGGGGTFGYGPGGGSALNSGAPGGGFTGGDGGTNTGGGGGGAPWAGGTMGGAGGSGIVVIRYLAPNILKAQVKTFTRSGTTWNNKGTITGYDISFGRAIKLSSNGNTIVIGSPGSAIYGTYPNLSSNIGQAYVYGFQGGTTWTQLGQAIQGISGGDEFGSSVSMSNNGTIIAVGSDNNSSNRGQVRVFAYANNYWYQVSNAINGKTVSSKAGMHALSGDGTTLIQSNNTYNSVYGMNKPLAFVPSNTTINTTISGDLAVTGRTILKSFRISNNHNFDVSINGYSSHYLASSDISASIVDYYSNVGSIYNKVFKIDACGNVTNYSNVYGTISDSRLKENIVTSSPKLEDMLKVRVVNYNLKGSDKTKYIGVLAQELEELFPELVTDDSTGERFKSVNYSSLTILLIKAFQEQQVLINNLNATLEELEK